jgi:hypothetical protein
MNALRLWLSRNIGILWPPVGVWEPETYRCTMRRLRPDGAYEYRAMSTEEIQDQLSREAW